ncbi:MAG TPA: hypothetical protein VFA68_11110 [Terriglobales bacterium]|nr:hypothetical protein [Terriglobales bacterium]
MNAIARKLGLGAVLLALSAFGLAQATDTVTPSQDTSAKQDMKDAGHHTKMAAKKTGHAVKKGTKKAAHKTARKTRQGAQKVEDKTAPPQ